MAVPATLSKPIITDLLRDDLGFTGVVFSDDLDMKGVRLRQSLESCAIDAIRAGCDVLLICHSTEAVDRVLDALVREAESDPAFCDRVLVAAQRNLAARYRCPPRPALQLGSLEHVLLGEDAQRLFSEIDDRIMPPS
jgi:beta-N-acetylhexosaminidase